MNKHRAMKALGISLLVVGLAACGGGGDTSAKNSDPQAGETTAANTTTAATAAAAAEDPSGEAGATAGAVSMGPVKITSSFNSWLSDAYANGVGEAWQTPNTALATSADRSKILLSAPASGAAAPFVSDSAIHNVSDGEVVKKLEGIWCGPFPGSNHSLDGTAYCFETPAMMEGKLQVVSVDIATGETSDVLNGTGIGMVVVPLAKKDDLHFLMITSDVLSSVIAFDTNTREIAWTADNVSVVPGGCFALDDALVCQADELSGGMKADELSGGMKADELSGGMKFVALSIADGSERDGFEMPMGSTGVMTDQGFVVTDPSSGKSTLLRLDGSEETVDFSPNGITRTNVLTYYPHAGSIVEFDALMAAELPAAVDREGNMVVENLGMDKLTASESGKVVFHEGVASRSITTPDGAEPIASFDVLGTSLIDGIVVTTSAGAGGATIHPPAS